MIYLVLIAFASLVQGFLVTYDELYLKHSVLGKNIEQISIYIYLIVEATCSLLFIRSYLRSRQTRRILALVNILFVICVIAYWQTHASIKVYPWFITNSEGFLIIAGALCFFYELFNYKPYLNLIREPSFWAISGMLVVYSAITPLFLVFNYLRKSDPALTSKLYIINHTSYCLLFITFVTAIVLDKNGYPKTINNIG